MCSVVFIQATAKSGLPAPPPTEGGSVFTRIATVFEQDPTFPSHGLHQSDCRTRVNGNVLS